ncbi:MAG: hypothetical protein K9N51_08755 [Candidatus Pacebacteria bacterium]|nr:hypothetical protein [Candidatus Paceibacterota bacterium]
MSDERVHNQLTATQTRHLQRCLAAVDFDDDLNLVRGQGRGHERGMQQRSIAYHHQAPGTARFIMLQAMVGHDTQRVYRALQALTALIDDDPQNETHGCVRWYYENDRCEDTNAAFFTGFPLVCAWIARNEWHDGEIGEAFRDYFSKAVKWFLHTARHPSFFYPNKCYGDCALLYSFGHVLDDSKLTEEGLDFCRRWFDYLRRRGCGWGEDHSIAYANVLIRMSLLLLVIGCPDGLRKQVTEFLDDIMDFVGFHNGYVPIPAIRGKHSGEVFHEFTPWFDLDSTKLTGKSAAAFVLVPRCGYSPPPPRMDVPRERIHRTFDDEYSVAWVERHARLGTLSRWPLMPNMYHHAEWGVGRQATPAAFIAADRNSGYLQWKAVDDRGTTRCHPATGCSGVNRFESCPLTRPLTFLPEVIQIAHQKQGAAIVVREIHRLHAPLQDLSDLWRIPKFSGDLFIDGIRWEQKPLQCRPEWCVLDYGNVTVAIKPLRTRGVADPEPRETILDIALDGDGIVLKNTLYDGPADEVCEPLLYTGWCVLLMQDRDGVDEWDVQEEFKDDGEIPRTYQEYVRSIALQGPDTSLILHRDPLNESATVRA